MNRVRAMVSTDVSRCGEIVVSSAFFQQYGLTATGTERVLAAALDAPRAELHVAESAGEILGFSWVEDGGAFGRTPYLRLLAVDATLHGRGVGRALMDALEQRHADKRDIMLLVTEANDLARGFYERLGYRQVGLLEDYVRDGTHECLYRKTLHRQAGVST